MEQLVRAVTTESWRRAQLRRLDGCLYELENAHERGEAIVSDSVAALLQEHVPWARAGMLITQALDQVFQAQERYLLDGAHPPWTFPPPDDDACPGDGKAVAPYPRLDGDEPPGHGQESPAPLDEAGARSLTEAIRAASRQVCVLLLEAHDRCAWSALGYPTWEQYVRRELGLSRSRSYELLDQGRVIVSVQRAAGLAAVPDISAYAAMQVKRHLPELLAAVRARVQGRSWPEAERSIAEIVREFRARTPRERRFGARRLAQPRVLVRAPDPGRVHELVDALLAMPPPEDAAANAGVEYLGKLDGLEAAADWLSRFVSVLRRRWRAGPASRAIG